MTSASDIHITSIWAIIALAILGITGNLTPYVMPIIVGGLVDDLGFTTQQAGYIATAEMAGLALGAYIWSRLIMKVNWRLVAVSAILLSMAGNLVSSLVSDIYELMLLRTVAGTGSGIFLTIGNAGLSLTKNPVRTFGIVSIAGQITAGVSIFVFGNLIVSLGMDGVFLSMAGITILLCIFVTALPACPPYIKENNRDKYANISIMDVLQNPLYRYAVLGVFLFFLGAINFWVYLERAAVAFAFEMDLIVNSLSAAQIAGACGAASAAVLSTRLESKAIPLFTCILLAAVSCITVASHPPVVFFVIAACTLNFAWTGFYAYLMGMLISLDSSAQIVAYSLSVQTIAKIIGPALAATFLLADGFSIIYGVCAFCFILSLLCFIPPSRSLAIRLKH